MDIVVKHKDLISYQKHYQLTDEDMAVLKALFAQKNNRNNIGKNELCRNDCSKTGILLLESKEAVESKSRQDWLKEVGQQVIIKLAQQSIKAKTRESQVQPQISLIPLGQSSDNQYPSYPVAPETQAFLAQDNDMVSEHAFSNSCWSSCTLL